MNIYNVISCFNKNTIFKKIILPIMSSTVLNKKVAPKRILKPDCDKTQCDKGFFYL